MSFAMLAAALLVQSEAAAPPLAAISGAARYRLAASTDLMLAELDPGSAASIVRALGLGRDPDTGPAWSRIAAGAIQVRREAQDSADTLWFNPVLDAGLVIRWLREGETWTAIAAAPVLGETLRGEVVAGSAPLWAAGSGNLAIALKVSAARSFAAADAGSWNRLFAAAPYEALPVSERPDVAHRALAEMRLSPGYADSLTLLYRILTTEASGRAMPAAMRDSLVALGDAARLTLRPITALRRPDGWTVVLQSPDAPKIAWFAHFADPAPGAQALPAGFAAVALDGAETP